MDIDRILQELRQERAAIEEVILLLERLGTSRGKRKGRPPRWLQEIRAAAAPPDGGHASAPQPRHRRPINEESRLKMAEAQRRRRERERQQTAEN